MLTETAARWLLVLHTGLAVAAVGAATHLVLWFRKYKRGKPIPIKAVRRFAWITLVLHASAFLAGNIVYPTYKVQVRSAYLENSTAITNDALAKQQEYDRLAERDNQARFLVEPTGERIKTAAKAARWFDVKEHWVALGLIVCAALVLVLSLWDPRKDGAALTPIIGGLAYLVAGTLWLGAIIGVLTASWRSV